MALFSRRFIYHRRKRGFARPTADVSRSAEHRSRPAKPKVPGRKRTTSSRFGSKRTKRPKRPFPPIARDSDTLDLDLGGCTLDLRGLVSAGGSILVESGGVLTLGLDTVVPDCCRPMPVQLGTTELTAADLTVECGVTGADIGDGNVLCGGATITEEEYCAALMRALIDTRVRRVRKLLRWRVKHGDLCDRRARRIYRRMRRWIRRPENCSARVLGQLSFQIFPDGSITAVESGDFSADCGELDVDECGPPLEEIT